MLKRFSVGLLLLGVLLGAVPVSAFASMHGAPASNPFKHGAHAHKMHCLLHGHHIDGPCPHLMKGRGKLPVRCAISAECGGKPKGTAPATAPVGSLAWGVLGTAMGFPVRSERLSPLDLPSYSPAIPDLQDPPPQSF